MGRSMATRAKRVAAKWTVSNLGGCVSLDSGRNIGRGEGLGSLSERYGPTTEVTELLVIDGLRLPGSICVVMKFVGVIK